jgi:uncharacterized protein YceH (UPF0502 family)
MNAFDAIKELQRPPQTFASLRARLQELFDFKVINEYDRDLKTINVRVKGFDEEAERKLSQYVWTQLLTESVGKSGLTERAFVFTFSPSRNGDKGTTEFRMRYNFT